MPARPPGLRASVRAHRVVGLQLPRVRDAPAQASSNAGARPTVGQIRRHRVTMGVIRGVSLHPIARLLCAEADHYRPRRLGLDCRKQRVDAANSAFTGSPSKPLIDLGNEK